MAWAAILPTLPVATKAAAKDAQPIALDDGVITFGVALTPVASVDAAPILTEASPVGSSRSTATQRRTTSAVPISTAAASTRRRAGTATAIARVTGQSGRTR